MILCRVENFFVSNPSIVEYLLFRPKFELKTWQITFRLQSSNLFSPNNKSLLTTVIKTAFISILISGPQVNLILFISHETIFCWKSVLKFTEFSFLWFERTGGFGHLVWNYLSGPEFSFYQYFPLVSPLFLLHFVLFYTGAWIFLQLPT